jgi:hypothetical protein
MYPVCIYQLLDDTTPLKMIDDDLIYLTNKQHTGCLPWAGSSPTPASLPAAPVAEMYWGRSTLQSSSM